MPNWNKEYYDSLQKKFSTLAEGLDDRLESVIDGRVTPALDDIAIGSARKMRAAVLFFDIRGFTNRTSSSDLKVLKKTLFMLDCVIPMVMHVIYDYDGFIEKNTGDGLMAIIGAEHTDSEAANKAVDAAVTIFYVIKHIVNPFLVQNDIDPVDARIGIDMGTMLIARIGLPSGTAKHPRNFLTAVSTAANLASKIQVMAGTNEIWTGDLIKENVEDWKKKFFTLKTPQNWSWEYSNKKTVYNIWLYDAVRTIPV